VDGREICRRLKNNPETKDIRVVMISAHPGGKEASEKYRADGFLAKPFSLEELLSAAEEK
jgi:two-component system alkaline phosphatase synthesis response regulator PhoP